MNGTILITGANRGIGLGLAKRFLANGWNVLATCRTPNQSPELATLALNYPEECEILTLEVSDAASVAALAENLECTRRAIDVLVNNAGVNPEPRDARIDCVPIVAVQQTLDVNLLGALRVLQAAVPALRRGVNPRVVNISSGAGSMMHYSSPRPQPAYCISKAALNMLTRCAARDLSGIVVVSVSPGWIHTGIGSPGADLGVDEATAALADTIAKLQPAHTGQWLDRFGSPSAYAW
jgi:NAD(P)-dependent dehydrogenase (short-subunit alcohol dehydrogenase family)